MMNAPQFLQEAFLAPPPPLATLLSALSRFLPSFSLQAFLGELVASNPLSGAALREAS